MLGCGEGLEYAIDHVGSNARAVVHDGNFDAARIVAATGSHLDRAGAAGGGDGLDGVVDQVDQDLLELHMVAVQRWKPRTGRHLDGDLAGGGVGLHERHRLTDDRMDVDRARLRCAAAQEIAHMPQDVAGVVDLGDHARQVGVGTIEIAAGRAQDVLHRSRQRPRRRHRLGDFMGEGGGHAAHEIEAGGLSGLRLLLFGARLGLACHSVGVAAFGDGDADDQTGRGQDQHLGLKVGEYLGAVAAQVQESHQAKLGGGEGHAGAVEAAPQGRGHDRQEQQVEQLVTATAVAGENDEQRHHDHAGEQQRFRNEGRDLQGIEMVAVNDETQQQRCHHRDADDVADDQRHRRVPHVGPIESADADQEDREQGSARHRAAQAGAQENQDVAQMTEPAVEAESAADEPGDCGVARRCQRGER